ncbi:MAG: diacylglycerol kinase family protein [Chitinophagaceae bacterium]
MQKNIAILANLMAGRGKAVKTTMAIEKFLQNYSINYNLFINDWPASLDGFTEAWIVGGDGTINFFINKYREFNIPLAIIKAGTGNDFAWHLYKNATLSDQLNIINNAKARHVDAGECNGRLFLNGIGIGFDGEVVNSLTRPGLLAGHAAYMWTVIKKILSFREKFFTIQIDGKTSSRKLLLLIIANGSRVGGGFYVSPNSDITDKKLDLLLCEPLSIFKRIRYLPAIEKGKHLHLPFIQHELITDITVRAVEQIYAHVDGELIYASEFKIKLLPAKYLFLY